MIGEIDMTVFWTIISGVLTFIIGEVVLKLVIEPVQEMRKTIAAISHAYIEFQPVTANPGLPAEEVMKNASRELRRLSSQLNAHLFLVPYYDLTARLFGLPKRNKTESAIRNLIGLSNGVFQSSENIYEINAKSWKRICESLLIPHEADK